MSNRKFILKYTMYDLSGTTCREQWYNIDRGMSSPHFAKARTMDTHELTLTLRYMSNSIGSNRYTNIRIREVTPNDYT